MYKRIPGRDNTVGHSITHDLPIRLDPQRYKGAQIFAGDYMHYSDGHVWLKMLEAAIDQPTALPPNTAIEFRQLRLTPFSSKADFTHQGTVFEISATNDFSDPTRISLAEPSSLYELTSEDGLDHGDVFWWRGAYVSDGPQSEFSLPIKQVYPNPVQTPVARSGARESLVAFEYSRFDSAFGFTFQRAEVQIFDNPDAAGDPVQTISDIKNNDETEAPSLPGEDGVFFYWRVRYVGVDPEGFGLYATDWTAPRPYLQNPSTIVMQWNTLLGETRVVKLPLFGTVNAAVDWGDGGDLEYVTEAGWLAHNYADDGTYVVTISGQVTHYGSSDVDDESQSKLVRVLAIGHSMGLTSLDHAFVNCINLVAAPTIIPQGIASFDSTFQNCKNFNGELDRWDLSAATALGSMLAGCEVFDRPIGRWRFREDVAIDIHGLLSGCKRFNQPIGEWTVGGVHSLNNLFDGCEAFDQDLSAWLPYSVTSLDGTFRNCKAFNHPLASWGQAFGEGLQSCVGTFDNAESFNQPLTTWQVPRCQNFIAMFRNAKAFNQPLDHWQFNTEVEVALREMFLGAEAFNQNLDSWANRLTTVYSLEHLFYGATLFNNGATPKTSNTAPGIGSWDVGSCISFEGTFRLCESFNQPLGGWSLSSAQSTRLMFDGARAFDQDLGGWESASSTLRHVGDMSYMFRRALAFNNAASPSIGAWNVSGCKSFHAMFDGAGAFNQPIGTWPFSTDPLVSINCDYMFQHAGLFNQPLGAWTMTRVTSMAYMFRYATNFNQDISTWERDTPGDESTLINTTNMAAMFADARAFGHGAAWDIGNWRVDHVTSMSWMFHNTGRGVDTSLSRGFNQPIGGWNVSNCASFSRMFSGCNEFDQDLSSWLTAPAVNPGISSMFHGCSKFNNGGSPGINDWNVAGITSFSYLFYGCAAFNQPLDQWDMSSAVSLGSMFRGALSFNKNLSNWQRNTPGDESTLENVTSLGLTFEGASAFNNAGDPGIENWSLPNCRDVHRTFRSATAFNQPLNGWQLSPTEIYDAFYGAAAFNQPLDQWDVSGVISFWRCFLNTIAFDQSLAAWDVSNAQDLREFLMNTSISTANLDATLIAWSQLPNLESDVTLDLGASTYSNTTAVNNALSILIDDKRWTISSGGPV